VRIERGILGGETPHCQGEVWAKPWRWRNSRQRLRQQLEGYDRDITYINKIFVQDSYEDNRDFGVFAINKPHAIDDDYEQVRIVSK